MSQSLRIASIASPGNLAGLGAILCWSAMMPLMRINAERLGPFVMMAVLYLGGGLIALFIRRREITLHAIKSLGTSRKTILCGYFFALHEFCFSAAVGIAQDRTTSITAYLINYLWPTLTVLMSLAVFKMRPNGTMLIALGIAFSGVAIGVAGDMYQSSTFTLHNYQVYFIAIIAALTWSTYSTLTRKHQDAVPQMAVPFFMLCNGIMCLGVALYVQYTTVFQWYYIPELIFMIVLSPIGFILWDYSMRAGDMVLVGVGANLTPLLSTIIASFYLSLSLPANTWIGLMMVVVAGIVARKSLKASSEL